MDCPPTFLTALNSRNARSTSMPQSVTGQPGPWHGPSSPVARPRTPTSARALRRRRRGGGPGVAYDQKNRRTFLRSQAKYANRGLKSCSGVGHLQQGGGLALEFLQNSGLRPQFLLQLCSPPRRGPHFLIQPTSLHTFPFVRRHERYANAWLAQGGRKLCA